MEMMPARVGDLCVYRANSLLVPGTLRDSEFGLVATIMLKRRKFLASGQCGEVFQTEVYSNNSGAGREVVGNLALENDIPTAPRVLDEITCPIFTNNNKSEEHTSELQSIMLR